MKTIIPNIWMLLFRLALLTLFIYIYQWPIEKIKTGQHLVNPVGFWLGFILITVFPAYLLWTLFGVLWIRISSDNSIIRFHYLYKTIENTGSDFDGYYKTTHKTKSNWDWKSMNEPPSLSLISVRAPFDSKNSTTIVKQNLFKPKNKQTNNK